jgi:hypothetical protein
MVRRENIEKGGDMIVSVCGFGEQERRTMHSWDQYFEQ